jgi:VanZ family protein
VRAFKYWMPVVLWMALIFGGSTDFMSGHHTSRFLVPLIRWFYPGLSPEAVDVIQTGIRKFWHLTEYGVLALLVWNALARPFDAGAVRWEAEAARRTLLICALYAASDEFHQAFVPSRGSSVYDVALDVCGSALALAALWQGGRWRKIW